MTQFQILTAAGANDSSEWQTMLANRAFLQINGTFSGQTVTVQTMSPDGEIIPIENGDLTEPTTKLFDFAKGVIYRLTVSNGGTPAINAFITYQD